MLLTLHKATYTVGNYQLQIQYKEMDIPIIDKSFVINALYLRDFLAFIAITITYLKYIRRNRMQE